MVGLNAGAQFDSTIVPWVEQSSARQVRLNFILTEEQSNTHDPLFYEMYDGIISSYVSRNISIYGLIGAESVKGGYDRNNPDAFMQPFTESCSDIIQRYQNVIPMFEVDT